MSTRETKGTTETKQNSSIQSPVTPTSLPLEFSSSNTYVPASDTTDPTVLEEKEHTRRSRQMPSLPATPLARTDAVAPTTNNSKNLRELLRPVYEARAKIHSLVFIDHELPIHEVHFTLDQYNEEQEKARLTRRVSSRETKEEKTSAHYLDKKDDKQPTDAWSSLLHQQRGGEMARQPVAVSEIFTSNKQLAEKIGKADEKEDAKNLPALPIHRVLIIGPPGSGKTTLSKYLAQQWSVGKLWQERYDQVFWLTLRDLGSPANFERLAQCKASAFPLAALLHQFGLDETAQRQIGIKQIHQLLITKPQQTLLILDGFDEVAQTFSDSSEASQSLKSLLTAAMTAACDLIVTSRGYSLPPSQFQFDRRLVNQGFTDEQVKSYIQQHFASLPKPDGKQATEVQRLVPNEVQRLVQGNYRLWTYAHNPLILSLTCDFYRDAHESGKTRLTDLSLINLYDNTLRIFIRRYLDVQSQVLGKLELAWEKTKNWSRDELFSTCPIEIDFLQTLAFEGVEAGVQRFDRALKEQALTTVCTRYPTAKKERFILALGVGLLHEFPSAHDSPLDRTHEFTHLTFQEYLAARYLAERLKNNDPEAYQWLRTYKYHASYRQIFDFLCGLMPPKSETFWRVLLEEQTDLTGFGQLSLRLYSLEAGHFHRDIPGVRRYVAEVGQLLIHYVKIGKFIEATELRTVLGHCPQLFSQLNESFWHELKPLLTEKEGKINQHAWRLLDFMATQAGQLSSQRRQWLWAELFQTAVENPEVQYEAAQALAGYAEQAGQFTADERRKLLTILLEAVENEGPNVRRAAAKALRSFAAGAGQFPADERSAPLKALLQAVKNKYRDVRRAAAEALVNYAEQVFTAGERSELLTTLLQTVGSQNSAVQQAAVEALERCAGQAGQLTDDEHAELLTILLEAVENEDPDVRVAAAWALKRYAEQVGRFITGERAELLKTLLQAAGSQNSAVQRVAAGALERYAEQAGRFITGESTQLLKALLQAAGNEDPDVQRVAAEALRRYAEQMEQFITGECSKLLKPLLQAAKSQNSVMQRVAAGALKRYAEQAGRFSADEHSKLLKALLQAAGNEDSDEQLAAEGALERYAEQTEQFIIGERIELLKVWLQAAGSKNPKVRGTAALAVEGYASQMGQFTTGERIELLTTLLQAAGEENSAVQEVAAWALERCAEQVGQFTSGECSELLKALRQVAWKENSAVQTLMRCAEQAGQFTAGERSKLLTALLLLTILRQVAWKENFEVQALMCCAEQVGQFTAGERSKLLKALLQDAKNKYRDVQLVAVQGLAHCAGQAGQFIDDERSALLKALLQAVENENRKIQTAAAMFMEGYASQVGQFTAGECSELLKTLLQAAGNKDSYYVQPAAVQALAHCVKQAAKFSAEERPQLVIALFTFAKKAFTKAEAIEVINTIPFASDDLVSGPFFKNYFIYKENLGEPLSVKNELLLSATPLTELLYAYSRDSAEPPAELLYGYTTDTEICEAVEKGFFNSRCSLWLKFILARVANAHIHKEAVTLTIVDDGCVLHGSQLAQPVRVPIPEERLWELAKALANQAKEQGLPVYAKKPKLGLPDKIDTRPSVQDSGNELAEDKSAKLMEALSQTNQKIEKIEDRVDSHEQRLGDRELRLQNAERDISQLKVQVQAYEEALKAHKVAMADLTKEVKVIGKNVEGLITDSKDTVKAAIHHNEALQAQKVELSELTKKLAQVDKEAKEQGKTIESLGESYNALQQQQRELQDKCEKSEAKLLNQYEELADQLKTRLEAVEKADAKQDKACKDLQEKQQALEESLKKMGSEIETLQSADAHTLAELQKLQALQAWQEEMVKAFDATQKQLLERQSLLSEPKFAQFYRAMHLKLSGFFLVCTVVATGLIKAESQASLPEKILGVLGNILMPGVKEAVSFIKSMIEWHRKHQEEEGRKQALNSAPISFSDKEAAIDLAVQEVIYRYGQHIKVLTEKGVADLAECGVNRIAHGIQDEALFEPQPSNFPLYLVQFLHRVKLKQGKLGHKDLATEVGIIEQGKKPWNEDGIFRRTGIQGPTQYHYSNKVEHFLLSKDRPICNYQKYGFRQVGDAKLAEAMAAQQQFDKTNPTLPTDSFKFKPLATPLQQAHQGPLSMWGKIKQAGKGAAENKLPDAVPWAADHRRDITDGVQSAINQAGGAMASSVTTVAEGCGHFFEKL